MIRTTTGTAATSTGTVHAVSSKAGRMIAACTGRAFTPGVAKDPSAGITCSACRKGLAAGRIIREDTITPAEI